MKKVAASRCSSCIVIGTITNHIAQMHTQLLSPLTLQQLRKLRGIHLHTVHMHLNVHAYTLEMCSVSTNGERASPAIALASSLFSLSTYWVCFSWKFYRPNPFGANLETLFHSYTWRFYFLTEPNLTAHHIQVEYRLNFATVLAQ